MRHRMRMSSRTIRTATHTTAAAPIAASSHQSQAGGPGGPRPNAFVGNTSGGSWPGIGYPELTTPSSMSSPRLGT